LRNTDQRENRKNGNQGGEEVESCVKGERRKQIEFLKGKVEGHPSNNQYEIRTTKCGIVRRRKSSRGAHLKQNPGVLL